MKFDQRRRGRVGASEAVGAMLAIAMTLIAGTAAWGFIRSQAAVSEGAVAQGAQNTNNYLGEHFGVEDMYFGTSTTATFIIYNTGTYTFQMASVRFYDSAGLINIFFNTTSHSPCTSDCVTDLRSSQASKCKTAASSYETPSLTKTTLKVTDEQLYTITIPPTASNCPSYGQTISSTYTYTVVVTGLYGNAVSSSALG